MSDENTGLDGSNGDPVQDGGLMMACETERSATQEVKSVLDVAHGRRADGAGHGAATRQLKPQTRQQVCREWI